MWDFGRHDFIKSGIHDFETFFLKLSLQARLMKMSSLLILINGTKNKA